MCGTGTCVYNVGKLRTAYNVVEFGKPFVTDNVSVHRVVSYDLTNYKD